MYHVGIDWADRKHDVAIVDAHGALVGKPFTIANTLAGFEQLHTHLARLSPDPHAFKIGIETQQHLLVDFLLDGDYPAWAMSPAAMKSLRKRYRTSGARDDRFDAFVLADALRTDTACWRAIDLGSELVREIRLLAKAHHDLVAWQVALTNTLRSTLKAYYPEALEFFADVACANALAFWQAYPSFEAARQLSHEALLAFFKAHRLCNRQIAERIYARLAQPHFVVAPAVLRAKLRHAQTCVTQLLALAPELETYTSRLREVVAQHPDGEIFLSYPGASHVTAARLLALFGDNRERYRSAQELQGLAGSCPVTQKTGNHFRMIYYRRACNKFHRDTVQQLAFSSLTKAAWAKAYYDRHRAQGHRHSHALRCLANLHLRILFAMWQNRTPYDENLFLAQKTRHQLANPKK